MKKRVVVLLLAAALLLAWGAPALAETIAVDLESATDEELAGIIEMLRAEQRARIKTEIRLDMTEVTVAKGKTQKIAAEVTGLPEGVSAPKLVWTSADDTVAKVSAGTVTGVAAGNTVITCSAALPEDVVITAEVNVTVISAVTGVSADAKSYTLGVGEYLTPAYKVLPEDATDPSLAFESDKPSVVTVDKSGNLRGVTPGTATVTAAACDGSGKSVAFTVYVPSLKADKTEYTVTAKSGMTLTVNYYGASMDDLKFAYSGSAATSEVKFDPMESELKIKLVPVKAGPYTITITDAADAKSKVVLKVTVDHSAVYDATSYPLIEYTNAFRYPEDYLGKNCSFSGKVLQSIKMDGGMAYRITSHGRYDDVVFVEIYSADLLTPILEDDSVTVYGRYAGTYSYTSIMGGEITIPLVLAERINLK